MPPQPADINILSPAATTHAIPQPAAQEAMWNALLQPLKDGRPPEMTRQPIGLPPILSVRPLPDSNFILANGGDDGEPQVRQQMPWQQYQHTKRRTPSAPLGAGLGGGLAESNLSEKLGTEMTERERGDEQELSQFIEAYRRLKEAQGRQPISDQRSPQPTDPVQNIPREDSLGLIGSARAQPQVQKPPPAAKIDQFHRGAGMLPNGALVSSFNSPDGYIGNDAIDSVDSGGRGQQSNQDTGGTAGGIRPADLNIHLVGDDDAPSDLSPYARHQLGVKASIATHIERGFEVVIDKPRAVDVPGFSTPRYYDYIIRDPVTGLHYGVEVKTTLYETIRLKPTQVMKDAVVVARGAKVRATGLELNGVGYSTYCFDCEALDFRSAALLDILRNAGVPVARGMLPGDIRR